MREWRLKNREKYLEQNRRHQKKWIEKLKKYPKKKKIINRKKYLKQRSKVLVRSRLRHQVRIGKIKRLPCEVCGKKPSQAHHKDYSKPFDVRWLCKKHHDELHRK